MISIVVPSLNEEKYIRACLESLKNQDYAYSHEIIVVDNGCTDKTPQIAREMGVKVVYCPRQGVTYARQAGAETARGEIIVQADADTVYPRTWLTSLVNQLILHPEAIAVAGTYIYRNPPWWAVFEYYLRMIANLVTVVLFGRPYVISGANFAFEKDAWTKIGGYEPKEYSSDQFNISSRLSKIGKIIYHRKGYCATSERSVAKPVFIILMDFIRNLAEFAINNAKGRSSTFRRRGKKLDSVSTGTWIKILFPIVWLSILSTGSNYLILLQAAA